ncbi:acyl-CoA dehydrogenase family protein [Cupriavidus sp. L7L]|uniref:acyl-CoA dehydrogenase family protein n=1 Tax=Cupriavidus sp. L7L TaxID=2546443 RepID=UPI0010569930|nr:acyl-CoA dehydrogenase family protein [Cupriavidus sp. L7L]TDF64515.1 DNA alkylation response protein [Cupriavidus sp. L7L]
MKSVAFTETPGLENLASCSPEKLVAPDCAGQNFYEIDPSLSGLLSLYLPATAREHLEPHLTRLGAVAGGRLNELAMAADKERNRPLLRTRSRFGVDEDWIEYHPSYSEMERIAFCDFGIHTMTRTPGVLGWPDKHTALSKYAFQYLFVQSEFGLMCPICVTDSSAYLVERYGDEELKQRFLPGMSSTKDGEYLRGAQFMTERTGGSDVGTNRLRAQWDGTSWRLYGDKWFCSAVDADVVLLLARPEGAPDGSRGLALFAMPKHLDDGSRNRYRVARLKEKMGTRSMPSGEVIFDGALAYLVGDIGQGLKQMLDQVNLSRLSHGVRAAAMMRRCLNEALAVSHYRVAFGRRLIDMPLQRRQLMKLVLPTEQALSVFAYTARLLEQAERGDQHAELQVRILTPLLKFRACRDNVKVATGSMEVRGGNGYIEDFVNERLVRDAHLGVLWEGTSNINALDAVQRAAGKEGSHRVLLQALSNSMSELSALPDRFAQLLLKELRQASEFMDECVQSREGEADVRTASSRMYHAASASIMAIEGVRLGDSAGDARRLLISRQVLRHRLHEATLSSGNDDLLEQRLLSQDPVSLSEALGWLA